MGGERSCAVLHRSHREAPMVRPSNARSELIGTLSCATRVEKRCSESAARLTRPCPARWAWSRPTRPSALLCEGSEAGPCSGAPYRRTPRGIEKKRELCDFSAAGAGRRVGGSPYPNMEGLTAVTAITVYLTFLYHLYFYYFYPWRGGPKIFLPTPMEKSRRPRRQGTSRSFIRKCRNTSIRLPHQKSRASQSGRWCVGFSV